MCVVFADISKAFDRVWRKALLFKLKQNGIDSKLLSWISDYLSNRKQRVFIGNAKSDLKIITAGIPQGSVLGPLFFLIYINDIAEHMLSITRLFADDSSLSVATSNTEYMEGILNHDLQIMSEWAKTWLVKFNLNKFYL